MVRVGGGRFFAAVLLAVFCPAESLADGNDSEGSCDEVGWCSAHPISDCSEPFVHDSCPCRCPGPHQSLALIPSNICGGAFSYIVSLYPALDTGKQYN
eukprot:SAG31_NODE_56_length_29726_cov_41.443312_4_plen_98_part_00